MIKIDLKEWRNDVRTYGALSELKTLALLDEIERLRGESDQRLTSWADMKQHRDAAEAKLVKVRDWAKRIGITTILGVTITRNEKDALLAILDETE